MEYIKGTTKFNIDEACVISLGKFDGLHRGHELLMENMVNKKNQGLATVLFTFDIPPKPEQSGERLKVLTTNEEKVQLCAEQGIDYLIECPFTEEIRNMQADDFIRMLVDSMQVKCMVVGTDFHFGHNRSGDYKLLAEYAPVYGYELIVVDKMQHEGRDISSTYIREEVQKGNMEKAKLLLGYDYFVHGVVVHGRHMGGSVLGIPTMNVLPQENKLLPPFGVYAVEIQMKDSFYQGITDVGCKPTVEGENPVAVETHIFNFNQDVYGQEVRVRFKTRIRDEKKFPSLEALKEQLEKDIAYGRYYFKLR